MTGSVKAQAKVALLRQATLAQPQSAASLYQFAAALADAGEAREAAGIFRKAYVLRPSIEAVLPAGAGGPGGDAAALRDRAAALIEHGAAFSPVIAALAVGEAHLGNAAAVRDLVDYDRFFRSSVMDPPAGYDLEQFNRALAVEIKTTELKFYDAPNQRPLQGGWRSGEITESGLPAIRLWTQAIRREIERYVAELPRDADHPFLVARPADYVLGAWAVVSQSESYHRFHLHPRAWVTGVYYTMRPAVSREPGSRRGWLRVGPPEDYGVSTAHGWGERAIAPEPGTLVLMPGYFFHGTYPTGADEERICIAFDVMPTELIVDRRNFTDS